MQELAALLWWSVWLACLELGSCAQSQLSMTGRNDISGTWLTRVDGVQINVTHRANASSEHLWSYRDWQLNMTFDNVTPQKTDGENSTDWNYDVFIIDVNVPRNQTHLPEETQRGVTSPSERYPGYRRFPGLGLYKLHEDRLRWLDAVDACDEEMAYLAIVNSQREAEAIQELFVPQTRSDVPAAYLGLSYHSSVSSFVSVHGERMEELAYSGWDYGQPDHKKGDDCVVLSRLGLMSDESCFLHLPYICEAWTLD